MARKPPSERPGESTASLIRRTGKKIDFFKRNAMARRLKLMEGWGIDLVLDVGANTGQYAKILRKAGYRGSIVSFEPLSRAFARLARAASHDRRWRVLRVALGARDHEATIHVSGDSQASSLLPMLPRHRQAGAYFATVGEERIQVRKLDSIWSDHVPARSRTYLKLDTQGFEKQVLRGAARSLDRVQAVQVEMSIVPLYQGTMLLPDMLRTMQKQGLTLVSLEYGFCHPETGQMFQVDGIFART
jgi:FkbM family methyltransferase